MKIAIITVGKLKEKYLQAAVAEYRKRLSRYITLDIIELADEKTSEGASQTEEEQVRQKEGERIRKQIRDDWYCIALAIEGKELDSVALSDNIANLMVRGNSNICFVIGGSLGLSKEILGRADMLLSFSKLTFPHQLMRVILLEQIYRSFRIMKGEPYHK